MVYDYHLLDMGPDLLPVSTLLVPAHSEELEAGTRGQMYRLGYQRP